MYILIFILFVVATVLSFTWHFFFNWYAQKREREAQEFLDSLRRGSQKTLEEMI